MFMDNSRQAVRVIELRLMSITAPSGPKTNASVIKPAGTD